MAAISGVDSIRPSDFGKIMITVNLNKVVNCLMIKLECQQEMVH